MGSCLSIFIYYIFPYRHFLNLKFQLEISLFFACDFLSHLVGTNVMLTYGVPFESFYILYLPLSSFFVDLKLLPEIGIDFARDFLSPVAGANGILPYGVRFEFRYFQYLLISSFFVSQTLQMKSPFFFHPRFFIYWRMGWDGRSVHFFFCPIPWKLLDIFFIINPGPFNKGFSTSFRIFGEKKSECSFFF